MNNNGYTIPLFEKSAAQMASAGSRNSIEINNKRLKHFLFTVRCNLQTAADTVDVYIDILEPTNALNWCEFYHFTQIVGVYNDVQFKEFEQILGHFRIRVVNSAAFVAGDYIYIGCYATE